MSISISGWSGRLGNNIQQVSNCMMYAEKNGISFEQRLPHEIISNFSHKFGDNEANGAGRFYSWEPIVNCSASSYSGGNEVGMDREYVFSNTRRICKEYVAPHLNLPEKKLLGDDTIVMHLRSGDNYHRIFEPPTNYIPNPLIFYLNLIESFDKCILITEPDRENPIVHELAKIDKVKIQSSTVADDFATLMNARNVALSGVGTFAMAAALCSSHITNLYTTDLLLTEHLNYTLLQGTDVTVNVMELDNYLPVYPCSWKNSEEQRKFIVEYGISNEQN